MAASQWAEAGIRLRALVAARPGFRLPTDPAGTGGITAYAGPAPETTSDLGDYVSIGYADGQDAGRFDQAAGPADPTRRPRDELGEIRCLASGQTGNPDATDALTAAFAAMGGVEAALRDDPTLGMVPGIPLMRAQIGQAAAIRWDNGPRGPVCAIEFTVTYTARI